ncbi:MAG: DUF4190 domain-containing protein [Clostridia bacterium]|nr:DUF4190 domain-containing protein [Clostridia bacterium]
MRYCTKCGCGCGDDVAYCPKCGSLFSEQQPNNQQPSYQQPNFQQAYQQPPYMAAKTNGMAIASLVLSIVNLCGIGCIVGIVLGFVARSQIKNSYGAQKGDGLALAGIIIGFVLIGIFIITIPIIVADVSLFNTFNHTANELNSYPVG